MRWPWRRREPVAEVSAFDASVDLDLSHLDRAARGVAAEAIAARLRALPGAGWISVEPHAGAALSVTLYPAGSGVAAEGDAWDALRGTVEGLVRQVLAEMPVAREREAEQGWSVPAAMAGGFAEAMAPSQFDALEQLAALAALSRAPPPVVKPAVPKPPPKPVIQAAPMDDAGRLARLLALVLPVDGTAPAASAVHRFGSYAAVLAAPEAELRRVPGLGQHSIAAIKLVHAAAVRLARAGITARPVLDDRKRLFDYLAAALARERIEQFRVLFLDEHGMLRADEVQAQGTVNHTPVYPREVVRRALALEAASLVLVHNHPSGDPKPSREDMDMTRQVQEAAAVMGIGLRDHVIVGNGRWLSFRDEGFLN